jgi:ABC-type phosphate transport system substrate-binding protein
MVRLRVRHLLAAAFLAAVAPAAPAAAQQRPASADDDTIVLVANPDVPVATLAPSDARRIFLLRQRFWPHGQRIAPVNLPAASPLRRDFSLKLLGRSVREMSEYWNEMYFHGTEPPAVLESERAVLLYVARTPGAIGYIRAATLRAAPERDDLKILLTIQP